MARKAVLLLGLLLTAGLLLARADDAAAGEAVDDDDYADQERAHLVVRKYIEEEWGTVGSNLTVKLSVFNGGSSLASGVEIEDAALPEGWELLEGSLKAQLGKVDVGSTATRSYVVKPTEGAQWFTLKPAKVTYKPIIDDKEVQVGYSSSPRIYVLTPRQKIERHLLTAGSYATLGMVTTTTSWRNLAVLLVVVVSVLGINHAVKGVNQARATQKRKRALESLEKEQ